MTVFYFAYNSNNALPPLPKIDAREMPNQFQGVFESDENIWARVRNHPLFEGLVANTIKYHELWGNVAVGCQYGKHRSRAVAEMAAHRMDKRAEPWTPDSLN